MTIATEEFTLEQAEEEISELRGQLDLLTENHSFGDATDVPNSLGLGNGSALYSQNGVAQHMTDTGLAGSIPVTTGDTNSFTNTGTPFSALSQVYTIPANDAAAGTVYRITSWGNGTWGSTAQAMGWGIGFPGTAEFGTHQAFGSSAFSASAAFRWNCILWVICLSPGSTGAWNGSCTFSISETANSITGASAAAMSLGAAQGPSSNITVDSTVAQTLCFMTQWGSTTGSPTITCHGTFFERVAT